MAAEVKTSSESERMAVIETRMETFVTQEQHERDNGDIRVMIGGYPWRHQGFTWRHEQSEVAA